MISGCQIGGSHVQLSSTDFAWGTRHVVTWGAWVLVRVDVYDMSRTKRADISWSDAPREVREEADRLIAIVVPK